MIANYSCQCHARVKDRYLVRPHCDACDGRGCFDCDETGLNFRAWACLVCNARVDTPQNEGDE